MCLIFASVMQHNTTLNIMLLYSSRLYFYGGTMIV